MSICQPVGLCRGVAHKRVRHEALLFRMEVRDLRLLVVAVRQRREPALLWHWLGRKLGFTSRSYSAAGNSTA